MRALLYVCLLGFINQTMAEDRQFPRRKRNAPVTLSGQYVCYPLETGEGFCRRCDKCKPIWPPIVIIFEDEKPLTPISRFSPRPQ